MKDDKIDKMVESIRISVQKEIEVKEEISKHGKPSLLVGFYGTGKDYLEIIPRQLSNKTIKPIKEYRDIYPPGILISSLHHAYIKGLHIPLIREYDLNIETAYKTFEASGDKGSVQLLDLMLNSSVELLIEILDHIYNDRDISINLITGQNINVYDFLTDDVIYKPLSGFTAGNIPKNIKHMTGLNMTTVFLQSMTFLTMVLAEIIESIRGGQRLKKCNKCSAYIFVSDKTSHCPYCDNRETKQEMNLRKQISRLEARGYFGNKLQEMVRIYMEKKDFTEEEIEEKLKDLEGGNK